MPIKGPQSSDTSQTGPAPKNPRDNSQRGGNSSNRNLAIAAGGGIVLFVFVISAAVLTNTSDTSAPAPSAPIASSTESAETSLWGAWAVTTEGETYLGWSYNEPTEQEAKQAAISSCSREGGLKCTTLTTFGSGFAALASGKTNWFGIGGMSTAEEARNEALKGCKAADPEPDTCSMDKEFYF